MLVLSRKLGERIVIGSPPNQVVLTVTGFGRHGGVVNSVRLAFAADPSIPIWREEIIPPPQPVQKESPGAPDQEAPR